MMAKKCSLAHWLWQPVRVAWWGVERTGRLIGVGPPAPDVRDNRTDELLEALVAAQVRTSELVATLGRTGAPDASAELREQIVALRREVELLTLANAPTHARLEELADSVAEVKATLSSGSFSALEMRLGQAVAAQERTNQLLEYALHAGFEEDERARGR